MLNAIKILTLVALITASMSLTGCGKESTLLAPETTLDTAPPAVPTGLAAAPGRQNVKLVWDANVLDEDFAGFMIYRVLWGTPYPMLTTPTRNTTWVDTNPVNVACTYAVTALDWTGNESAWAAVGYVAETEPPALQRH
ncbi:hypothetical protein CSB20_00985 [bacterium DOLZORAL124_64_63]|nr:MAG: hypothetical protein CSB20_00985 [bacterium DOLZORAL124_64_63]